MLRHMLTGYARPHTVTRLRALAGPDPPSRLDRPVVAIDDDPVTPRRHPSAEPPAGDDPYPDISAIVVDLVCARVEAVYSERSLMPEATAVRRAPFVLGVTGGVGAGKSTVARDLARSLGSLHGAPRVDVVSTDGFLLPNAQLAELGMLERKGYPESYDRGRLLEFLGALRAGGAPLDVPVYSHLHYDVVQGEEQVVRGPDVLVLEGLHLLGDAPPDERGRPTRAVRDLLDFCVYLDAEVADQRRWFLDRFDVLRRAAADTADAHPYFRLDDEAAFALANAAWEHVNEPNLVQYVLPTRPRADAIVVLGPDHGVREVVIARPGHEGVDGRE
jgi:type I pantothenate kinase